MDFTHQQEFTQLLLSIISATIRNVKNNKQSMLLKLEHTLSPYVALE